MQNVIIKPIKTEKYYEMVIKRLEIIFDSFPDSNFGDEVEILSLLNLENAIKLK